MLGYTIELISLAASNSLAVFCFCNLIIAILLVGSSKTSPQFDRQEKSLPNAENFRKLENYSSQETMITSVDERELSSVSIDMVEEEEGGEESPEVEAKEKEEDDDELRKRVEEFIEKVNSGWKAEKKTTRLSLGQQLSLDHS